MRLSVNSNAYVLHHGFNPTVLRPSQRKTDNKSLLLSVAEVAAGTSVQPVGI
jgi:hypothetical protein